MNRNQMRETRYEPRYEDGRGSPFRQQYERPRDISPQRPSYDRSLDPRANPHSEVYDPRFNPASPLPEYHKFPQPQYRYSNEMEYDARASPFRQQYERPRDISPQRPSYDRSLDPRANPHSEVYDPRFNPASLPEYHKFPQPQFLNSNKTECKHHRTAQVKGERHFEADRYEQKKYDYRYDNRFHKVPGEEKRPQYDQWQPAYDPQVQYGPSDSTPRQSYDEIQAAGRANKYSTRITDLLTSIKDPEIKDDRVHKLMEANKGYLVLMRFRPSDLSEVINAVQHSVSTLTSHHGYCIGFSEPSEMVIVQPSNQMLANEAWWDSRNKRQSRHAVACFWFETYNDARTWFETGCIRFKQFDFPNGNSYQAMVVPLTYGRNSDPRSFSPDGDQVTLLWSEYPHIYERYVADFLQNYSEPVRGLIKYFGGNPNVSVSRYVPGEPPVLNKFGSPGYARLEVPKERVGRSLKHPWVPKDSFITVSTFPSMQEVQRLYSDEEFNRLKLSGYSEPVVVAITLTKVQGTSKA